MVLAARGEAALNKIADKCRAEGAEVLVVKTDTSRHGDMEHLAHKVLDTYGGFDIWINNAGLIYYGAFDETPLEEFRQVIETNFFGYVYGCQVALKHFKPKGRGMIINVGSGYGGFPAPYASAYVSSKFAVRGLSASLRQELTIEKQNGIHVCTVMPATVDTPVYQHAANRTGKRVIAMQPVYPVETVVSAIKDLIERPRNEVVVGSAAKGALLLYRLSPKVGERVMSWYVSRQNYEDSETPPHTGNIFSSVSQGHITGGWSTKPRQALKWAGLGVTGAILLGLTVVALRRKRSIGNE